MERANAIHLNTMNRQILTLTSELRATEPKLQQLKERTAQCEELKRARDRDYSVMQELYALKHTYQSQARSYRVLLKHVVVAGYVWRFRQAKVQVMQHSHLLQFMRELRAYSVAEAERDTQTPPHHSFEPKALNKTYLKLQNEVSACVDCLFLSRLIVSFAMHAIGDVWYQPTNR